MHRLPAWSFLGLALSSCGVYSGEGTSTSSEDPLDVRAPSPAAAPPVAPAAPAAPAASLRVLPLGDSITQGYCASYGAGVCHPGSDYALPPSDPAAFTPSMCAARAIPDANDGGYRTSLVAQLSASGRAATFLGSMASGPTRHEGRAGWRADQLAYCVANGGWIDPSAPPDVVLLHAGTNDVAKGASAELIKQRLDAMLRAIAARAPRARVFVAQITPLANASWEPVVRAFNARVPAAVAEARARGQAASLVDMHAVVGVGDLFDGIHPTAEGYRKMAAVWFNKIASPCGDRADCTFDTRAIVRVGSRDVESITAYGRGFNYFVDNGEPWEGNGFRLGAVPRYASGPCAGHEPCTFDTRAFVQVGGQVVESITAYGRGWNFVGDAPWGAQGFALDGVPRFHAGPCVGTGCTFETRTMVDVSGKAIESITAGGKGYNFLDGAPWGAQGFSLAGVPRFAQGPCAGHDPCVFDTRTMVGNVESITAYGRGWNFVGESPWGAQGFELATVSRFGTK